MERVKMPLAIGRGLDRATGLAATQPQYPLDARNVFARDAKMSLRAGLAGTPYDDLTWGTDILAIAPIKATGDELFCVYDRVSRELRIFRLIVATGEIQEPTAIWGTLSPDAAFPVVTAAECDGKVLFAHDEGAFVLRLATVFYTPNAADPTSVGTLSTLMADLDGDGVEAPVRFRGVIAYLEYVVGWGYGSEEIGEEDRGDIARLSNPAEPTVFLPANYVLVGARADPIRGAVPTENVLALGKENESYRLIGTSPLDFGIEPLDPRYGVVSARCAVNIGGIGYWWSQDGARKVLAAGTVPIAQPLELISPLPDDLPDLGPSRECFVVYDRRRYLVEWLFPNLTRAAVRTTGFALSLWEPSDPRWTFMVHEQALACAGELLLSDDVEAPPPTGYADNLAANDVDIASDPRFRSVLLSWDNNDFDGNEIVQVFAKPAGGSWSLVVSLAIGGSSQQTTLDALLPLTEYEIAIRYTRGVQVTPGYAGDNPDAWTAPTADDSKVIFETSSAAVTWVSDVFTTPSGPVTITWASDQLNVPYLIEKDPGGGFVEVASDVFANQYVYAVPGGELGLTIPFRVTAKRGAIVGPNTGSNDVEMFLTVGQPAWVSAVWTVASGVAALDWTDASGATSYLLEKSTNGGASWTPVATIAPSNYNYAPLDAELNTTVKFRVTGKNGALSGPVSATQDVTFTIALDPPVVSGVTWESQADNPAFTQVVSYGNMRVVWAAIAGATSYRVERSPNGVGGWVSVGTTTATQFLNPITPSELKDPSGFARVWHYRVFALRSGVADSAASNVGNDTVDYSIVNVITSVVALGGGRVEVSWSGPGPVGLSRWGNGGTVFMGVSGDISASPSIVSAFFGGSGGGSASSLFTLGAGGFPAPNIPTSVPFGPVTVT